MRCFEKFWGVFAELWGGLGSFFLLIFYLLYSSTPHLPMHPHIIFINMRKIFNAREFDHFSSFVCGASSFIVVSFFFLRSHHSGGAIVGSGPSACDIHLKKFDSRR